MQTILGGGGAVGTELARNLIRYTDKIRIVSRNPKRVNKTDELLATDLTKRQQVFDAVKGSEIVYVTIGFDYNIKVWREQWPSFMQNVIDACKKHKSKLVFFDNIYMYDRRYLADMTEETPVNPSSKKGEVRAKVANMITNEFDKGELTALIARSADFYGPGNDKSVLGITVIENFRKNKSAMWFARADKIHNYTYTPDAGAATALLGNTPDAFGQVWHLPTSHEKYTGEKWIRLIAKAMDVKPRFRVMPIWLLGLLGFFVPIMKELKEMAYQYDRDYYFNSTKFESRFNFKPTEISAGIKETIKSLS
jgi:nucleoside-diphosphate-sugar epimerase